MQVSKKRNVYILIILIVLVVILSTVFTREIALAIYNKDSLLPQNWAVPFLELEYLKTKDTDMLYRLCRINTGLGSEEAKFKRFIRRFKRYDESVQDKDNSYWDMYLVYITYLGMDGEADKLIELYERDKEIAPIRVMVPYHNILMNAGYEDIVVNVWTEIVDSPVYTECKNLFIVSYVSICFNSLCEHYSEEDVIADEDYLSELIARKKAYLRKTGGWLMDWVDQYPTSDILMRDAQPVSYHLELGEKEIFYLPD